MNPLRKDIEDYVKILFRFLKQASTRLEGIRNNPLFLPSYSWNDEDRYIRDLASTYMQKYRPNQRGINIAISAYKDLTHKLRNVEYISGNLDEVLIRGYVRRIYDSNFTDKVPFVVKNQADMDWDVISQRLNEMGNFVDENIDFLASQIARKGKMGRSLRSRSVSKKAITIDDNVFDLGNNI